MEKIKKTSDAKKGGLFVGKSHDEGGIPAIVVDTGQPIEVESGEAIINKKATAKHWKELSKINESTGGVPIPPPDRADELLEKFEKGGKLTQLEKKTIHNKWKNLVNMTYTQLKKYYDSKDGKSSGLTQKEADDLGIDSGRESAVWIMKMKRTNYKDWTPEMWRWAKKQISFISRMRGNKGELMDNGKRTPKLKSLLIWGHNPYKYEGGGDIPKESKHPVDANSLQVMLKYASKEDAPAIQEQIAKLKQVHKEKYKKKSVKYAGGGKPSDIASAILGLKALLKYPELLEKYDKENIEYTIKGLEILDKMHPSEIDPNDTSTGVKFIKYKDSEIMYEPIDKKYYANDEEFNSLEDAKAFLDSGKVSDSIRGAMAYEASDDFIIDENKPKDFESSVFIHETDKDAYDSILKSGFKFGVNPLITRGIYSVPKQWKESKFRESGYEIQFKLKPGSKIFWTDTEKPMRFIQGITGNDFFENLYKKWYKQSTDYPFDDRLKMPENIKKLFLEKFTENVNKWLDKNGYCGIQQGGEIVITNLNCITDIKGYSKNEPKTFLAPNGKPSNLTPEQYKLVRTPEFKAWFGDWENDPKNSSKVIDENGEPLVVYRGDSSASKKGNIFKKGFNRMGFINKNRLPNQYFYYFVNSKDVALEYAKNQIEDHNNNVKYAGKGKMWEPKVTSYFLNIKDPLDITPNNPFFPTFQEYENSIKKELGQKWYKEEEYRTPYDYGNYISTSSLNKIYQQKFGKNYLDIDEYYDLPKHQKESFENDWRTQLVWSYFVEYKDSDFTSNILHRLYQNMKKSKVDGLIFLEKTHWNDDFIDNIDDYRSGKKKYDYKNWKKIPKVFAAIESNQIKIADGTNTTFDSNNPDIRFEDGGSVSNQTLLAPNGKPSNLTPEQYKLVRTPEFKAWFGDWENLIQIKMNDSGIDEVSWKKISDTVSKIVDENGEPLVVYHGTKSEFNIFDKRKRGSNTDAGIFGKGFYFSKNINTAENYGPIIKFAFLNVRNPFNNSHFQNKYELAKYLDIDEDILVEGGTGIKAYQSFTGIFSDAIKEKNHDGIITKFGEIVVFEPNQIKLADGSNTTFDSTNPDIRYKDGGKLNFTSYADAQFWMNEKSKDYKNQKEFYSSDEYKLAYPIINELYKIEKSDYSKKADTAMQELGVSYGDKVFYDYITPFMQSEKYSGTIVKRNGIPYVVLDEGQKTISGAKSTRWHKGWTKKKYSDGGRTEMTYKEKYNRKYGYDLNESHSLEEISKDTGVSLKGLQEIFNKGVGAYRTNPGSVRPNVKSPEQWAMARVYSAVMGGKTARIDAQELKMENGGLTDQKDKVTLDIPLLIRLLELSREDIKSDADLHKVVENILDVKNKSVLTMEDYEKIKKIVAEKKRYAKGGEVESDVFVTLKSPTEMLDEINYNAQFKPEL